MKVSLPRRGIRGYLLGLTPRHMPLLQTSCGALSEQNHAGSHELMRRSDVCRVPTPSANMYRGVYWKMK